MQIKKQEVEDAIMTHAELEFYAHGYQNASIRKIIQASGSSIGNFYNYFKNKEALFEALVSEEYHKFVRFMTQQEHDMNPFSSLGIMKGNDWKKNISEIMNNLLPEYVSRMLPDFSMRFVILIEGSKGTRFSDSRERLKLLIKEHLVEHAKESKSYLSGEICELLAEQFISGIIHLIKQSKEDKQTRNKSITDFILFYFMGVMGMLSMEK